MPPVGLTDTNPFVFPLQLTPLPLKLEVAVGLSKVTGSVKESFAEARTQPLSSVSITEYVPAVIFFKVSIPGIFISVVPLLQAKLYGSVPPPGVAIIKPLFPPLQETFEPLYSEREVEIIKESGCLTASKSVFEH